MNGLLNIIEHENKLLDKVFFHGDYLADRTASGKEECGIRLWHRVDEELMKEEVEELYHLIVTSSEMLKMLKKLCYKWVGNKLLIDNNDINQELLHLIAKAEGE